MGIGKQRSTFISYSRVNKEFAVRLARELKASGFSVWLDQLDIPPGARWDDELEAALQRCEIFMVILTPASMASDNVKDEIGYAIDNRKRILPVLLESSTIPLRLRRFQYVDFTGKSFDDGVEGAKELLQSLIQQATDPNMEIPPAFRAPDVQVEQEMQEETKRLAAQQAQRLAEIKAEEERAAKAEADRKAKEADRLAAQKVEEERLAKQKAEEEQAGKAKAEAERKAKAEARRKAKEEADRLAAQKAEEERAVQAKAEEDRLAAPKAEFLTPAPVPAAAKPQAQSVPPKRKLPMPLIIGAVVGVGLCAVVGIIFLSSRGSGGVAATEAPGALVEQSNPTDLPTQIFTEAPVATEAPIATEAPAAVSAPLVPVTGALHVYADDFSNPNSGWSNSDSGYYQNGSYDLHVADDKHYHTEEPQTTFSEYGPDISLSSYVSYPDDASVGLFCRKQGNGSFYQFQLDGKTGYGIWFNDGSDNWTKLTSGNLDSGLGTPYWIHGTCIGSELTLYVNFQQVSSVTDTKISDGGEFGLYIESKNPSGATAEFDQFVAYTPFTSSTCSMNNDQQVDLKIQNLTGKSLAAFWIDYNCNAMSYGVIPPGDSSMSTFVTHPLLFVDPDSDTVVSEYVGDAGNTSVVIQ